LRVTLESANEHANVHRGEVKSFEVCNKQHHATAATLRALSPADALSGSNCGLFRTLDCDELIRYFEEMDQETGLNADALIVFRKNKVEGEFCFQLMQGDTSADFAEILTELGVPSALDQIKFKSFLSRVLQNKVTV
jgi:hypothetical protein